MALLPNLGIGAFPNFVAAALTEITAGAEGATMTAANLKDPDPTNPARLTSTLPDAAWWAVDFRQATALRTLGLVHPSLKPGDRFRLVGVESGALPPVVSELLAPDSIAASTNLEPGSAVEDIDENPATPDKTIIQAEFAIQPWSVRLTFESPAATPAVGDALQCFVLVLNTGFTEFPEHIDQYPTVTASLYEGGVLRRVLGAKAMQLVPDGLVAIFPWNAGDLQTANGSAVELLLEFSGEDTFSQLDTVSWMCLHQSDVDAADYDTGVLVWPGAAQEPEWGGTTLEQTELPPPLWSLLVDPAVTLERLRVEFRAADGLGAFGDFQSTPPRPAASLIDVGVLLAGPLFESPFRFSPGGRLHYEWKTVGGEAITGSNRRTVQWRRRQAEIELADLPALTAQRVFERLDRAGPGHPFLLVLEPTEDDPPTARNTAFYAEVTLANGLVYGSDFEVDGQRCRGLSYEFTERL